MSATAGLLELYYGSSECDLADLWQMISMMSRNWHDFELCSYPSSNPSIWNIRLAHSKDHGDDLQSSYVTERTRNARV